MPCPLPGDLPNPGIQPGSPALKADSLPAELPKKPLHSPIRFGKEATEGFGVHSKEKETQHLKLLAEIKIRHDVAI